MSWTRFGRIFRKFFRFSPTFLSDDLRGAKIWTSDTEDSGENHKDAEAVQGTEFQSLLNLEEKQISSSENRLRDRRFQAVKVSQKKALVTESPVA